MTRLQRTLLSLLLACSWVAPPPGWAVGLEGGICRVGDRPITEAEPNGCERRTTTRIGIVANFDPDAAPISPVGIRLFSDPRPFRPVSTQQLEMTDLEGNTRRIELAFGRSAGSNEWRFFAGPVAQDGAALSAIGEVWDEGRVLFDARGRLVEPSGAVIRLSFPVAGVGIENGNGGGGNERFDQEILFAFRSARGESTQFASPFQVLDLENDGWVCPERPVAVGACLLSPDLLDEEFASEPETIYFSSRANLMSSAFELVQGQRFNPFSGELEQMLSNARLPASLVPPRATESLRVAFEVDDETLPRERVFDEGDPRGSSDYAITLRIIDSLGRASPLTLYLTRVSPERWDWTLAEPFDRGVGSTPTFTNSPIRRPLAEVLRGGRGAFYFAETGELLSVAQEGLAVPTGEYPVVSRRRAVGADARQEIAVDFSQGRTFLGEVNRVLDVAQDGFGAGVIEGVEVTEDFILVATTSAGERQSISRLAFASQGEAVCAFACGNGVDDDGDGLTDVGEDPGCSSGMDGQERSARLVCDDAQDSDGDGFGGFPEDPGCMSPFDDDESPANIEVKLVSIARKHGNQDEVVVAVLNRGGATFRYIDPLSLRLEPGSVPAFEAELEEVPGIEWRPDGPDADCDGLEDRLFRFRVARGALSNRRGEICLTGAFDSDVAPASGLARALSYASGRFERFEFKACTQDSRLKKRSGWGRHRSKERIPRADRRFRRKASDHSRNPRAIPKS